MESHGLKVAVVGATGAVGKQILLILEERRFPVSECLIFASPRSEGKSISFRQEKLKCQVLKKGCFKGVSIVFFDASDAISSEWVPEAVESGAWVVDNSATFRLAEDVPLIVPEVNVDELEERLSMGPKLLPRERIVAGPNCTVAPMVVVLKPILDRWGIHRVVLSTYQSVSGAGLKATAELMRQTADFLENKPLKPKIFPHQIAFNCIPHVGSFKEEGYTSEEWKTLYESRKILRLPDLKLTSTTVRVPTISCHAESINIECIRPFEIDEVRAVFKNHAAIKLMDDPIQNYYPMGMTAPGDVVEGAGGKDAVYVGRIRRDLTVPNGLNLWLVSDNLRKGAALNAVQIGEILLRAF